MDPEIEWCPQHGMTKHTVCVECRDQAVLAERKRIVALVRERARQQLTESLVTSQELSDLAAELEAESQP